jgi:flagellar motility protein MotE (MotC chaperone)
MKLAIRDIAIICATAILSFPVIYFLLLIATGVAKIEINQPKKELNTVKEIKLIRLNAKRDSLAAFQSQTFLALQQERLAIEKQKQELAEQQQRVKMVQDELEKTRAELALERIKLEKLVSQSDELDKKRIKQLAKVYSAMRPQEAARILETLDDDICINILGAMGDDRQKAKIMSVLSSEKASRVSKKISTPLKDKN